VPNKEEWIINLRIIEKLQAELKGEPSEEGRAILLDVKKKKIHLQLTKAKQGCQDP